MLIRAMIDHQIQYDFNLSFEPPLLNAPYPRLFQRLDLPCNNPIYHIHYPQVEKRTSGISIIHLRLDLEIIKLLDNSVKISDSISVAIHKTLRINLIHYGLFPPIVFIHKFLTLLYCPFCNTFYNVFLTKQIKDNNRSHAHNQSGRSQIPTFCKLSKEQICF